MKLVRYRRRGGAGVLIVRLYLDRPLREKDELQADLGIARRVAPRSHMGDAIRLEMELYIGQRRARVLVITEDVDGVAERHGVPLLRRAAAKVEVPHRRLEPAHAVEPVQLVERGTVDAVQSRIGLGIGGGIDGDQRATWVIRVR